MGAVAPGGRNASGYCAEPGRCYQTGDLLAESSFRYLARTDAGFAKGASVRALVRQYGLRSLREYQIDARQQINAQRQSGRAPVEAQGERAAAGLGPVVSRDEAGRPVVVVGAA